MEFYYYSFCFVLFLVSAFFLQKKNAVMRSRGFLIGAVAMLMLGVGKIIVDPKTDGNVSYIGSIGWILMAVVGFVVSIHYKRISERN